MPRLQIPYNKVLMDPNDFDPGDFDSLIKHFIDISRKHPLVLEIFTDYIQYFVFIRESQLHWAAASEKNSFRSIMIKEFFLKLKKTQFPKVVVYYTNLILYHSLLIYFQKKPDLKVNSSLVDLDDLLDKIEADKKSTLITAHQPGNLIMIRYQGGKAVSCYHGHSENQPAESDIREEFLVKVYTLSSRRPFEINLFTDLMATHADDARPIPLDFYGTISSFYLVQPPRLVVKLKNRPIKTYPFTGKEITIGRLTQNDIVIDNLSVSRKHAIISSTKNGYILCDLGSKNGTFLNGKPVEKAELKNNDIITIGKYKIVFHVPSSDESPVEDLDQTVIISNYKSEKSARDIQIHFPISQDLVPRLFRRSTHDEYILCKDKTVIGNRRDSDVRISGLFSPRVAIEITRQSSGYVIQKVNGRKKFSINGEETEEKILEEEDLIAIGSDEFVFKR